MLLVEEVFVVGYVFVEKKVMSFLIFLLIEYVRSKGVNLVVVDMKKFLEEQGFFDVIIYKYGGDSWIQELVEYKDCYLSVILIDFFVFIEKFLYCVIMLEVVVYIKVIEGLGIVGIFK